MKSQIATLQQFRTQLYTLFPKRGDAIINLLDALTSYGHHCGSVVQLSQADCFDRQYSSITDAIADGLPEAQWDQIMKLVFQCTRESSNVSANRFIIDCTSQPRPFAKSLADRSITYSPNPAPGNKPICVGHQYSMLTYLPSELLNRKKHWLVPLSVQRVSSERKGNEVGMEQIIHRIDDLGLADEMSISIGDTLYGTENCRATAAEQNNLVHIFRLNSKRNVYFAPDEQQDKASVRGRKKEYGEKMSLNDPEQHRSCDRHEQTTWTSARGKEYTVTIQCWDDMLLRGSRRFRASQHPLNVIKISAYNELGEALFKRPLWLAVFGQRRHEISPIDCYRDYAARYDIEHFFRFGKRKLLMAAYQTPDAVHEEHWWRLCLLAYVQLYLAKTLVPIMPNPWERYLPAYKSTAEGAHDPTTPSQTQRGFSTLLTSVGTPASACVARGKPRGRVDNEKPVKRLEQPIVFKSKSKQPQAKKEILSGFESASDCPDPQKIKTFITQVRKSLDNLNLTPTEFAKMLIDTG